MNYDAISHDLLTESENRDYVNDVQKRAYLQLLINKALEKVAFSCSAPLTGSIRQAKEEAVSAIYFDDSSDYRTALLNVVKHLDDELYALLLLDRKAAFKKVSE